MSTSGNNIVHTVPKWIKRIFRPRRQKGLEPEKKPPTGQTIAAVVAKWLVPSISALFITVGYVIVSAHKNLLGVESNGFETSEYLANASVFIYDLFTILPGAVLGTLTWAHPPSFEIVVLCLLVVALSATLIFLGMYKRNDYKYGHTFNQYICAVLLVGLVFSKFIILDAPLASIGNVLSHEVSIEKRLKTDKNQPWLDSFIAERAFRLWSEMVCSRISDPMLNYVKNSPVPCLRDELKSQEGIRSEFLAHSLLSILILLLSISVLRTTCKKDIAVIAFLTAAYTLTWPYAYGKLEKKTNYRYGQVIFKSVIMPSSSTTSLAVPAALTDKAGIASMYDGKIEHAIILESRSSTSNILVIKGSACPVQSDSSIQSEAKRQEVKLWEIPNSEIVAVKEIYLQDVITWKILNERSCPAVAPPPPPPPT
jgi:hypothetical protein